MIEFVGKDFRCQLFLDDRHNFGLGAFVHQRTSWNPVLDHLGFVYSRVVRPRTKRCRHQMKYFGWFDHQKFLNLNWSTQFFISLDSLN